MIKHWICPVNRFTPTQKFLRAVNKYFDHRIAPTISRNRATIKDLPLQLMENVQQIGQP